MINGTYALTSEPHDSRSMYHNTDENLFLYYIAANGGWFIGTAPGDLNTPAYLISNACQPFEAKVCVFAWVCA